MALAFLIAIFVLISASVIAFSSHWLPLLAIPAGSIVDQQIQFNFVVLGIVFILAQSALAVTVWRFRDRPATSSRGRQPSPAMEVCALVIAAVLFLGLDVVGLQAWVPGISRQVTANPVIVEVTGVQFQWYFRYPGQDGRFGHTLPRLVDASEGNPLGLDGTDPAAADDVVLSRLMLPENSDVELRLRSQDVIHSFFVPAFRLKHDAVPGSEATIELRTGQRGSYDLACAELCGSGHYKMAAKVEVVAKDRYGQFASGASAGP